MPSKPQTQSHAPETTTVNANTTSAPAAEWPFERLWVKDTPDETRTHFAERRLHGHSCWKVIESVRKLCSEADNYTPYAPFAPYEIHRFSALGCVYTTHNVRIDNGGWVFNATLKMRGDFSPDAVIRALENQRYLVVDVDSKITNWAIVDNANRDTEITRIFLGLLGNETPPFPSLDAAFQALVNLQSLDQMRPTKYAEEAQWRAEIEEFFAVFAQTNSEYSKWLRDADPVPTEIDVVKSDCQFKIPQAASAISKATASTPINANESKTKRKTKGKTAWCVEQWQAVYSNSKTPWVNILDDWNKLPEEKRKAIDPTDYHKFPSGRTGRDQVSKRCNRCG
ncbi:MAG: hypothetical protein ACRC46_11985 [Thermoguttaceae bacterium]